MKQIFNKKYLAKDLVAGLSVALVSIPEGIGFAMILGVNPIYGLYTGIIATIVGSLSTGSRLMIVTLTNALAISVASAMESTGNIGVLSALFMLTVMIGIIQMLFGFLKFDGLLRFISNPVMTGFVFGSATLIVLGQLEHISGYSTKQVFTNEFAKLYDWFLHIEVFDLSTILMGIVTIALIMLFKAINPLKHASYAIVLVVMTIIVFFTDQSSIAIVGDHTSVVGGLPELTVPTLSMFYELLIPAFAIAFIGLIDAAGVQVLFSDSKSRKKGHTQDFIGQGLANVIGGFFSGLPAGGSFSRTALNVDSGAKTRLAGIFSGIVTLIVVLFFASYIEMIPHTVLAGLLIVIGASIIVRLRHDVSMIFHTSLSASIAMISTFIATMVMPLYYAIFAGMIISFILYIVNRSHSSQLMQLKRMSEMRYKIVPPEKLKSNSITILTLINVNFFFAVANEMINNILPDDDEVSGTIVILHLRGHRSLNSTMIKMFADYAVDLQESGNTLILAGVEQKIIEQLQHTDVDEIIGRENIFVATDIMGDSTEQAWQAADKQLKKLNLNKM